MAQFTLKEVLEATHGQLLQSAQIEQYMNVVTDTRQLTQNCLFVALQGERFDGHDFVVRAVELGAGCVVVSRPIAVENAAVVLVDDTRDAFQRLAAYHRRRFKVPVIAITGSNGKTTTKDLTAAVLAQKYKTLKTMANFNNEIGLPLTLLQMTQEHEAAVVEMGMRGLGQIAQLAALAQPTIGIVTNVGETHMELLGCLENIACAKGELIDAVAHGVAILNADNEYTLAMRSRLKAAGRAVLFGCGSAADVRAFHIETNGVTTEFDCQIFDQTAHFTLPMAGRHNIYNALAAIAVGHELGLDTALIQRGLLQADMSAMRMAVSRKNGWTIINDAYNASPMSMQAALQALHDIAPQRRLAVLGDMLELGKAAAAAHQEIGRMAAADGVDAVIVIGDMARHIAEAAQAGGVPHVVRAADHQAAADALRKLLQDGDTILFKGSRGMQMEKVIELI